MVLILYPSCHHSLFTLLLKGGNNFWARTNSANIVFVLFQVCLLTLWPRPIVINTCDLAHFDSLVFTKVHQMIKYFLNKFQVHKIITMIIRQSERCYALHINWGICLLYISIYIYIYPYIYIRDIYIYINAYICYVYTYDMYEDMYC